MELPSATSIAAEAAGFKKVPANGTLSLIYGKVKGGYPIVNFEYAIVNSTQTSTSTAKDIRSVLEWVVNAIAELAIGKALSDENPARDYRWSAFLGGTLQPVST